MIRVLHVLGGLNRGGAETMVMNLYRAINKSKIQFDFITHSDTNDDYVEDIKNLGGKIYVFPEFKGYNIISYRNAWKKFFITHPEYKILHSHLRSYASIYIPIAKSYGLKTIIHSHSTSNGMGFKSVVKNILQIPLSKQADYLFSCSTEAGKWLFGDDSINKSNYFLLKNAINVEDYRYNEELRRNYRTHLNLENKIVYCHVGRLSEPKNHMFLLEIFKKISKVEKDSILLIIGEGSLRKEIDIKIKELNLLNKVIMMGSRDDVTDILQAVDLFLFPSLWEGLPVAVVEAQAAGLPCLVSDKVTSEVDLTPNVKYLPIDKGVDIWVNEALNIDKSRNEKSADIVIEAGYDIVSSAKWLSDFYRGLLND